MRGERSRCATSSSATSPRRATSWPAYLVVGSSTGLGEHVLPLLLGSFHEQHPTVSVTLRVESTVEIIDRVLERDLELGVVGAVRPHRALVYDPFLEDKIILAVPAQHRFAGRSIALDELRAEPLILMQSGAGVRTVIDEELRRAGVRQRDLRVAMELGLQESAKAAVEAGYGVSFLSSLAVERELRLGTLGVAEVEGIDPVRHFSTVRPATRAPGRLVEAFLSWCRMKLAADFGSKLAVGYLPDSPTWPREGTWDMPRTCWFRPTGSPSTRTTPMWSSPRSMRTPTSTERATFPARWRCTGRPSSSSR